MSEHIFLPFPINGLGDVLKSKLKYNFHFTYFNTHGAVKSMSFGKNQWIYQEFTVFLPGAGKATSRLSG